MRDDGLTLYQLLGVSVSATTAELDLARKGLARIFHPDRPGGNARKMMEINAAHATLSDPSEAKRYAAELRSHLPAVCGTCGATGQLKRMKGFHKITISVCPVCNGAGRVAK